MLPRTIAIDGTAAAGKSTLASTLAQTYNYLYLDTGIMYRAVTWYVLETKTDVDDEEKVSELAQNLDLHIQAYSGEEKCQSLVFVNGQDITSLIRTQAVNENVSRVSAYKRVRDIMTQRQREIAKAGPVVMVGRDIGTVVLPDADLKLFVEASVEVRAKRRYEECLERGEAADYEKIFSAMAYRDKLDSERSISPMVPAKDAVIIKTDQLSRSEVLEKVIRLMQIPDHV
jgi:cytidylate kinase